MFGIGEILVLVSLIVLVLGFRHIPKIGSSLGNSIRAFKRGLGKPEERPTRNVDELDKH